MRAAMLDVVFFGVFLLIGGPGSIIVGASSGPLFLSQSDPTLKPRRCHYGTSYKMTTVECDRLDYEELPELHTDIEVLYFSHNRLQELKNETLRNYSKLQYVILRENFVLSIDSGAFSAQEGTLKGIDLTKNPLTTFPMNILEYSSLIKLYLGKNRLDDTALNYTTESSLEVLELFSNRLTKIPTSLSLPKLQYLNVSKNQITKISPQDIAHFCSLTILDIKDNPLQFTNGCACHDLKKWIKLRNIRVTPTDIKCDACSSRANTSIALNEASKIYDSCREAERRMDDAKTLRLVLTIITPCIIVLIIIVLVVLYCTYKKRRERGENIKINKEHALSTNGATAELLNNGVKSQTEET